MIAPDRVVAGDSPARQSNEDPDRELTTKSSRRSFTIVSWLLELEVAAGCGPAWDGFGLTGRQQANHSAQIFPGGLIECGIGADQVADHVPCGQIQGAFGRRAHGQRD